MGRIDRLVSVFYTGLLGVTRLLAVRIAGVCQRVGTVKHQVVAVVCGEEDPRVIPADVLLNPMNNGQKSLVTGVLPQSEVEFCLTGVSMTPSGGISDEHRIPGQVAA